VSESRALRVAVIGATGLVGRELVALLDERSFPVGTLALYASPASTGATVEFRERATHVDPLPAQLPEVDVAFLCAPPEVSRDVAEDLAEGGALVIDLAPGDFGEAPLLLGAGDLGSAPRTARGGLWVRVPHPLTRMIVAPLRALGAAVRPTHVVGTLLLSASAFGRAAVERLSEESIALLNLQEGEEGTASQEAFRCTPLAPESAVSARVSAEVAALADLSLPPALHVARIPIFHGQAAALSLELASPVEIDEVRGALRGAPSLLVAGDEVTGAAVSTFDALGIDAIYIVGLRRDERDPRWLRFWTLADNVRQGAALAAVSLAEGILLKP
jgi:aspartate-semialdehyde dehydrogenase